MAELGLRGRLQIAVHLHTFRNIDLFQQGLYQLRISLSHFTANAVLLRQKLFATPAEIYQSMRPSPTSHLCLTRPHIDMEYHAFCSKVLLIRYSEEELVLDDTVMFWMDLTMGSDFDSQPVVMEVELLFSDILGGPIQDPSTCELRADREMKSVSTASYIFHRPCSGLCEFLQISFDSLHFSTVSCTIHCLLTQCRFVGERVGQQEEKKENVRELVVSEVCKCLFPSKGKPREFIGSESANKTYSKYVLSFASTSKRLAHELSNLPIQPTVDFPHPPTLPPADEFIDFVCSHSCINVVSHLLTRLQDVAKYHNSLFDFLLNSLQMTPELVANRLKSDYIRRLSQMCTLAIVRSAVKVSEIPIVFEEAIDTSHSTEAKNIRKNPQFLSLIHCRVENVGIITGPRDLPILFEDSYLVDRQGSAEVAGRVMMDESIISTKRKKRHLVILVHGFGGSSFDVRKLKNQIISERPEVLVYCSHSNEEEGSDGDILIMGRKLAIETQIFIGDYFPGKSLKRLSFIGHSMGGLVIRAALPFLTNYKAKMHLYMSLSTPHLGYIQRSSRLVDAGLWVIKKVKNSLSLSQVTMKDDSNPKRCALFTLAKYEGLEAFQHVFLLSSIQDNYAPFESARIQLSPETAADEPMGSIYIEMAKSITSTIQAQSLHRIDVNFDLELGNIDSMIGRAAHIQFLESEALMQTMLLGFQEAFHTPRSQLVSE